MARTKGANTYTADQFIKAIPGTGGIISQIAEKVGCSWHTAAKYIDRYSTVREAWLTERRQVTYVAQSKIIEAIQRGDLKMCKWWLAKMDTEFADRQMIDYTITWREEAAKQGIDVNQLYRSLVEEFTDAMAGSSDK
jgi:hypothetical protein